MTATFVSVDAKTYTYSQNVVFLSDNLRNSLRDIIRESGLSPEKLVGDWPSIEEGLRVWMHSRHLYQVTIEFYRPGASIASARWDIPIGYDGLGVSDDMWPDKEYLRQLIAKSAKPASDCTYRVVVFRHEGYPHVDGWQSATLRSTGSMVARSAGTIISAGQLTASATYWKAA